MSTTSAIATKPISGGDGGDSNVSGINNISPLSPSLNRSFESTLTTTTKTNIEQQNHHQQQQQQLQSPQSQYTTSNLEACVKDLHEKTFGPGGVVHINNFTKTNHQPGKNYEGFTTR